MNKLSKLLLLTACSVVIFSCEKATIEFNDKGVTKVVKPIGAGADSVRFSAAIYPLFEANCQSCHGGSGGFTITNVTTAHQEIMNINLATPGTIIPGDPANSGIMTKFTTTGDHNGVVVTQPNIDLLSTWISQGAKNN
ncbi:MAG: cytochrome c [Bacteroidota bacterium]